MSTETPSDWRRLFAGHAPDVDAYRITIAAGSRGSYVSTRPDRSVTRVQIGDVPALKCSEHGALIPSDLADAVHDEALALARDYAEAKHVTRVRYRLELLSEGETLGRSAGRWAPIEADDVPEDDGTDDGAKELRSLALLRHADRQVRELHKLNLEQAERYVQLAEQHGAAVQSYNEALLGMVHTIAAEREAADRPASIDPEVAREGIELARQWMAMHAAAKAAERTTTPAAPGPERRPVDVVRNVLDSLTPDEKRELEDAGLLVWLRDLAVDYSAKEAGDMKAELLTRAGELMQRLSPGLLAKLRPLGGLPVDDC